MRFIIFCLLPITAVILLWGASCQGEKTGALPKSTLAIGSAMPLSEDSLILSNTLPDAFPPDVLNKVLDRLWPIVSFQYNIERPEIKWKTGKQQKMATFLPPDNGLPARIWVDKAAYEVLLRILGTIKAEAALAHLIGHEIGHYTLFHKFGKDDKPCYYADAYGSDAPMPFKDEKDCDYFGAYTVHLAGYDLAGVLPIAMEALYKKYRLTDQNTQAYLPLEKRKIIASETVERVEHLAFLFKSAGWLAATHCHEEAAMLYEAIKQDYPSKEICNNLGANRLLAALWQDKNHKFALPIELVWKSRLQEVGNYQGGADLDAAIDALKEALAIDPAYRPALLNLLCAYAMQGNVLEAEKTNKLLKNKTTPEEALMADIALSVVYANAYIANKQVQDSLLAVKLLLNPKDNPAVPLEWRQMAAHNLSALHNPDWARPDPIEPALPKDLFVQQVSATACPPEGLQSFPMSEQLKGMEIKWAGPGQYKGCFKTKRGKNICVVHIDPKQLPPKTAQKIRSIHRLPRFRTENGWVVFFQKEGLGFEFDRRGNLFDVYRICKQ